MKNSCLSCHMNNCVCPDKDKEPTNNTPLLTEEEIKTRKSYYDKLVAGNLIKKGNAVYLGTDQKVYSLDDKESVATHSKEIKLPSKEVKREIDKMITSIRTGGIYPNRIGMDHSLPHERDYTTLTIYLHNDTIAELHKIGEECYTSKQDLITDAIEQYIERFKAQEKNENK